jgi:Double zinc ribbon
MPTLAYFGIESSGVTIAVDVLIVFGVLLYLALVYWTYSDARRRIVDPALVGCATAVSLFPFIGPLLYLIVRPPESLDDTQERELELEVTQLRLHQLESSLCPHCDHPVESDFLRCPSCLRKLKERCGQCSRPLDRSWTICPFCEAEVPGSSAPSHWAVGGRDPRTRSASDRERIGERPAPADGRRAARREEPVTPQAGTAVNASADGRLGLGQRLPRPATAGAEARDAPARRSSSPGR